MLLMKLTNLFELVPLLANTNMFGMCYKTCVTL